ncbi:MAG: energy-coupling factor ABC transporter permease [Candidatus Marsarchaeota archaeon]|nr:energy-coupling factor ABC transporter permease [Candidatus Marsarchaeota archaeon]
MGHIHIPDGVLPIWLVVAGWAVAAVVLGLAVYRLRGEDVRRKVPLLGVVAALMLVAMSTEIAPIAYHINLTVLAGILLGPALGIIAAFIVDLILALFGHGGVTVVGLNTITLGSEVVFGFLIFKGLVAVLRRFKWSPWVAGFVGTVLTLAISTSMLIGIVAASNINPATARELGPVNPDTLAFTNPFERGVISNVIVGGEAKGEPPAARISISTFAAIVYILGSIGWVIEGSIVALIVGFLGRARPDLVFGKAKQPSRQGR